MTFVENPAEAAIAPAADSPRCAACNQQTRSKQFRHHDHFVVIIKDLWNEIGGKQGLDSYYLQQHLQEVVVREQGGENRKQIAAGLCVPCMRFNTPVTICGECNVVDSLMRGGEQFIDGRGQIVKRPAHFTLRLEEIRDCVRRSDGTRRENSDPYVRQMYQEIIAAEAWADRLEMAASAVGETLAQTLNRFPVPGKN